MTTKYTVKHCRANPRNNERLEFSNKAEAMAEMRLHIADPDDYCGESILYDADWNAIAFRPFNKRRITHCR